MVMKSAEPAGHARSGILSTIHVRAVAFGAATRPARSNPAKVEMRTGEHSRLFMSSLQIRGRRWGNERPSGVILRDRRKIDAFKMEQRMYPVSRAKNTRCV